MPIIFKLEAGRPNLDIIRSGKSPLILIVRGYKVT